MAINAWHRDIDSAYCDSVAVCLSVCHTRVFCEHHWRNDVCLMLVSMTVTAAGGSATTSELLSSVVNLIVLLHDSIIRSAARVPLDFVSVSFECLVLVYRLYYKTCHSQHNGF